MPKVVQCTVVRFSRFFPGGFITAIVVNPPEMKLAKRTSVHCVPSQNGIWVKFQHFWPKMMVKSGLEKIVLKFLHALTMSFLLLNLYF